MSIHPLLQSNSGNDSTGFSLLSGIITSAKWIILHTLEVWDDRWYSQHVPTWTNPLYIVCILFVLFVLRIQTESINQSGKGEILEIFDDLWLQLRSTSKARTSAPDTRTPQWPKAIDSINPPPSPIGPLATRHVAFPVILMLRDHRCTWMLPWLSRSYHPGSWVQVLINYSCIMCQSKVAHGDEGGNLDLKWNRMCQGVDLNWIWGGLGNFTWWGISFFIFSSNFGHMSAILEGPTCRAHGKYMKHFTPPMIHNSWPSSFGNLK